MSKHLSRAEKRPVIIAARRMGCEFHQQSTEKKRDNGRLLIGVGWRWVAVPIKGNPPKNAGRRPNAQSLIGFPTKYEAAQDFLKWALVHIS